MKLRNMFVEFIPDELEVGVLYVSMKYRTTSHLCPCGCGHEVPLPLSQTRWRLTYNGEVSLDPSVGNWSFPCRSHYFIRDGAVLWAGDMSDATVQKGRAQAEEQRKRHYEGRAAEVSREAHHTAPLETPAGEVLGIWARVKRWLFGQKKPRS